MSKFAAFLLSLSVFFTQAAFSNDSTATVAAGGIQYKKSDQISMDEEILKISLNQIDITYRFFNHSDKEIQETVAFPLPLAPQPNSNPDWDEEYIARKLLQDKQCNLKCQSEHAAFINFTRTVNGAPYGQEYRIEAFHAASGKNITELLKKNNIPVSAAFLAGYMEEGELDRNPALKNTIKKLNLLDDKDKPLWKTRTTYFWTQFFPPKASILTTHSYRPRAGTYHARLAPTKPEEIILSMEKSKKLADYCPSKADKTAILAALKKPVEGRTDDIPNSIWVNEVQYILTTGANWNGPIKKFRLEITPPTPNTRVMFCWDGKIEKTSDGKLITTLENFTPKKDLKILFVL